MDNGADVINISLGRAPLGGDLDAPLRQAVKAAGKAGVLVVAAAGNQATDADENPLVPAAFSGNTIVSVAATDPDDLLATFSNWGDESVDLGAPGTNILSTTPLDYEPAPGHGSLSGTSPATPHVTAAAALVRSANPCSPPSVVRKTVLATVDPASDLVGRTVSGGRLDAAAAVSAALDRYGGPMHIEASAVPRPRRRPAQRGPVRRCQMRPDRQARRVPLDVWRRPGRRRQQSGPCLRRTRHIHSQGHGQVSVSVPKGGQPFPSSSGSPSRTWPPRCSTRRSPGSLPRG